MHSLINLIGVVTLYDITFHYSTLCTTQIMDNVGDQLQLVQFLWLIQYGRGGDNALDYSN